MRLPLRILHKVLSVYLTVYTFGYPPVPSKLAQSNHRPP
ncbi:hypothetical protein EnPhK30_gp49 [Escherichia phage K30]|uniref:Uncharacterized protein n=1 Tax=Escherichia phage K30 TaxID=1041524 RepID=F8R4U4_9CAUD|nr:hypothetical protein EnPhK30_gp49 [Escherichia phage K30]AEH41063.1 hypothetical protein [Escherichia phage K30]